MNDNNETINDIGYLMIILHLFTICSFNKIKGTILIANEGINGTISGSYQSINIIQKPKTTWTQEIPDARLQRQF